MFKDSEGNYVNFRDLKEYQKEIVFNEYFVLLEEIKKMQTLLEEASDKLLDVSVKYLETSIKYNELVGKVVE